LNLLQTLKGLDIKNNSIGYEGVKYISEALQYNTVALNLVIH